MLFIWRCPSCHLLLPQNTWKERQERYYHTEQIHRYTQAAREGKINQCTHTYFFTHWRTHKKRLCSAYDESTAKTEQMRAMATGKDWFNWAHRDGGSVRKARGRKREIIEMKRSGIWKRKEKERLGREKNLKHLFVLAFSRLCSLIRTDEKTNLSVLERTVCLQLTKPFKQHTKVKWKGHARLFIQFQLQQWL